MLHLEASLLALAAAFLVMAVTWAVHLADEDASIVDPMWGPTIWLVGLVHAVGAPVGLGGARLLAVIAVGAWAARLAWHLGRRHAQSGEDRRYRKMREARGERWWWQSLVVVFSLQAALAWVVALPLMAAATGTRDLGLLGVLGYAIFIFGFFFEAIADGQLARFKSKPDTGSSVFDDGLWRYSRHPNYFGEALLWWGMGIVALDSGAWWALLGPALVTFLLLKVSGVTMTEEDIADRRPEYRDYVRRTNAFLPGRPDATRPTE